MWGIIILLFNKIIDILFGYKREQVKKEEKFKELMSDLIYDTLSFCNTPYYSSKQELHNSNGDGHVNYIKNDNWKNEIKELNNSAKNINKFTLKNRIKDPNNIANNVYNTCVRLKIEKQKYPLSSSEELRNKFKKEFDYIKNNSNVFR